jgi:hypothetical protein
MTDRAFSIWMAVAVAVVVVLMSTPVTIGSLHGLTRLLPRAAASQPSAEAGVAVAQN